MLRSVHFEFRAKGGSNHKKECQYLCQYQVTVFVCLLSLPGEGDSVGVHNTHYQVKGLS